MKFDRQAFIDELYRLARLNIPWLHQGDNPDVGFDCIGVIKYAVERQMLFPAELAKEFAAYHRPPNGLHMLKVIRRWLPEVDPDEAEPGDLYVVYVRRNPCHMSIQMPDNMVAEAFEAPGTSRFMIRPFNQLDRIAACFRVPDEFPAG